MAPRSTPRRWRRGRADHLEREAEVPSYGEKRVEGVALEDHRHVALLRRQVVHDAVVDRHRPAVTVSSPASDAQRASCRNPRAEQDKQLARLDGEVDAVQHGRRAVLLDDALHLHTTRPALHDGAHRRPPPLTAPTVSPLTMCRCAKMPMRITGAIASIAPAARRAHCVCSTEMKLNIATVTGRTRLPPSTTANMNSFQALRKTKIVVTAMPPRLYQIFIISILFDWITMCTHQ